MRRSFQVHDDPEGSHIILDVIVNSCNLLYKLALCATVALEVATSEQLRRSYEACNFFFVLLCTGQARSRSSTQPLRQDGGPGSSIASSSSRLLRQMNSETDADLFVNPHPISDVQVVSSPTTHSNNLNQQITNLPVTGDATTNRLSNRQAHEFS